MELSAQPTLPCYAMLSQYFRYILLVAIVGSAFAQGSPEVEEPEKPKVALAVPSKAPANRLPQYSPGNPSAFKTFSRDLGRNFLGLFSQQNLLPLLVGAGATGGALALDDSVDDWFNQRHDGQGPSDYSRLASVEDVGNALGASLAVATGIGGLMVVNQFTDSSKLRSFTYASAQGFLLSNILAFGIKSSVRRERPDDSNRRAFPSGHTSNAFTMATIANHYYGSKVGIPALLFAGFVGVSRMDEGVHYLSDVVAGATMGYIIGRTVVRGTDRNRKIWYFPMVSTSERAFGVTVAARF